MNPSRKLLAKPTLTAANDHSPGELARCPVDFARLVGAEGWWRLPRAIRQRFSEHPQPGQPICYCGIMQTVECSWCGLRIARLCRLIGTPFAPYRGTAVPVAIRLLHRPDGAIAWEREYRFPGRTAVRVSSVKKTDAEGKLVECVGGGLGMRLAVFEANRALHFLSLRYFWTVGGRRIWLPRLLTPGTAHVIHEDLGGGRFRFSMSFHHRLLGTLFHQDGVFQREQETTS